MVFCGKPSKACLPCRQRRSKCDGRLPQCSQCVRAGRKCCGYRDTQSLTFRDQTAETVRKAQIKRVSRYPGKFLGNTTVKSRPKSTAWEMQVTKMEAYLDNERTLQLKFSSIAPDSLESLAICLFNSTYVWGPIRSFKYLSYHYEGASIPEHLSACIKAVGLATFSKTYRSSEIVNCSRRQYIYALRLTNSALQSSAHVTSDSTLSAVLLLDLFETIINQTEQRSVKSWTEHINGAAALMRLRGHEQFQTDVGIQMFIQMSSHMLLQCMHNGVPLPADYIDLHAYATQFISRKDASWHLMECSVRYTSLMASIHDGRLSDPDIILDIVSQLDIDMVSILHAMELDKHYERVLINDCSVSESTYEPFYDIYCDFPALEIGNTIRASRLPLLDLIQEYCRQCLSTPTAALSPINYLALIQLVTESVLDITSTVCASVPQLAGYLNDPMEPVAWHPQSISIAVSPSCIASAYSLLWPLFVCATNVAAPIELRAWTIRQYKRIGRQWNIPQATELARSMEERTELDIWTAYSNLGNVCYSRDD